MPGTVWRFTLMAFAISGPIALLVICSRFGGSETIAHAAAFIAVVFGLPWVIPAFVATAVLSAPVFVALHIMGHPQELMPWLSAVILIAGVVACHINAALLLAKVHAVRTHTRQAGLAEFLFRSPAGAG